MKTLRHFLTLAFASMSAAAAEPRAHLLQADFDGGGGWAFSARYATEASLSSMVGDVSLSENDAMRADHGYIASLNDPPVPRTDLLSTHAGSLLLSDLLRNDSDSEGESLSFTLLSTNTSSGGTILLSDGVLTYRPPPQLPSDGLDRVEYLLSDESAGAEVGTIIWSSQSYGADLIGVELLAKELRLSFRGTASSAYKLQFRSDLSPGSAWTDLNSLASAGPDGLHRFNVTTDLGQGYYRSVQSRSFRPAGIFRQGEQLHLTFRVGAGKNWKLQARASLRDDSVWEDYPSAQQPLRASADFDGTVTFALPQESPHYFFRAASHP